MVLGVPCSGVYSGNPELELWIASDPGTWEGNHSTPWALSSSRQLAPAGFGSGAQVLEGRPAALLQHHLGSLPRRGEARGPKSPSPGQEASRPGGLQAQPLDFCLFLVVVLVFCFFGGWGGGEKEASRRRVCSNCLNLFLP